MELQLQTMVESGKIFVVFGYSIPISHGHPFKYPECFHLKY